MQALPYVDSLIREYLLFRGFARASQAFAADAAADRGCGFQADALASLVFARLIPQRDGAALVELLEFLQARLFRHLDAELDAAVKKMQASSAVPVRGCRAGLPAKGCYWPASSKTCSPRLCRSCCRCSCRLPRCDGPARSRRLRCTLACSGHGCGDGRDAAPCLRAGVGAALLPRACHTGRQDGEHM